MKKTYMKTSSYNKKSGYRNSNDFIEALTTVEERAFPEFNREHAERFTEAFVKSIPYYLKNKLTGSKDSVSLLLPHGTFTSEDAGDVINVSFEFSKSAMEFASGDGDKLHRLDTDEYDAEFLELFKTWTAYDGPEKVDHAANGNKTWGIAFPNLDAVALIIQDVTSVIMSELQKFAKEGSITTVEIDSHGKYSLELNDGVAELSFEASKVFKQKGKDDSRD